MDPALHKAVTEGDLRMLNIILTADPKPLLSRTPQQNTALHIAARLGHRDIADRILKECETHLLEKNIDGDMPLHVALKFGNTEVADFLINYSLEWPIDIESEEGNPFTTKNKLGNTVLHEAVIHGKSEVALRLLKANPNVGHILNEKHESPLQIASRVGLEDVMSEILEDMAEEEMGPMLVPFPTGGRGGHIRNDLVKQVDRNGNNTLHYAAQNDNGKIVEMLITMEPSLAYGNNHDGLPPLHVAVCYGAKSAIKAILKHCPDTAEQLAPDGGNAFHIAVKKGRLDLLKCLLKHIQQEHLLNHRDSEGNTPLHLAAKQSMTEMSILLARDKRVNVCVLNNEGDTARSAIEMHKEISDNDLYVWSELKKIEAKRYQKHLIPPPRNASMQSKTEKYFNLSFQTYSLIAALITTVTFASTFTMPGGYDQQTGLAILRKEPSFKIFVIFNTIAMCSALVVMICFIWAREDVVKFKVIQRKLLHRLTILASVSLLVSLITAVYLVVDSKWLVSLVILIGLSTPVMVCLVLGFDGLSL
ncbi:ankyrin repeat family protein [Rhynchospora pubera]|uniref:Ankyrin repeat family protein n=1 Tax=Rhynchospora pubera TaxID=906938 RepID=A0AAV8BS81_9POAL|nr:ankyrin repeat family protein [Rhynchospora pubera]